MKNSNQNLIEAKKHLNEMIDGDSTLTVNFKLNEITFEMLQDWIDSTCENFSDEENDDTFSDLANYSAQDIFEVLQLQL